MDPFKEVEEDCWTQIRELEQFMQKSPRVTPDIEADFGNSYQELAETLEDLRQAVHISESNPVQFSLSSEDIAGRKQILGQLSRKVAGLQADWDRHVSDRHRPREVTTMSNRISQDSSPRPAYRDGGFGEGDAGDGSLAHVDREFNQFQQQEMLHTQDLQLDSIHRTMQSLNQQAAMMGGELEDQGYMLDNLDAEMDTLAGKLSRGMKRVNYVIDKNRESASNWCIGILVVLLCALLFVLIVV